MSVCNYTQLISPNTCLGDSLATFNANFSALDEGLCGMPDVVPGLGINANLEISEQTHSAIRISTKNSFVYKTEFDYKNVATSSTILLSDGTTTPTTKFPYVSAIFTDAPIGTFSTLSLTDSAPKVTMFWTASGADDLTVFATNSSINALEQGPISFNGPVTSLLSSGNLLYVGGEFTSVGGIDCKKFCAIDISSGSSHLTLGTVGTLVGNPLSAYGDLGLVGTVHAIAEYATLLIVGGSFNSPLKGRGLTILDRTTGLVYPFYVNGVVNDLLVVGTNLYVGGTFDYVNYAAQSAPVISGLRVYTNGLLKISLDTLIGFPNSSIVQSFAANVINTFGEPATVNAFAAKASTIYIGGSFRTKSGTQLTGRSLAIINADGTQNLSWKPIVSGDVFTLAVDGDYLYVGGAFRSFHSSSQYLSNPRQNDSVTEAYNAVCFNVSASTPSYESNWKPQFNGAVTKFAFHDSSLDGIVYCYGKFTQINASNVSYLAAVEKSYNNLTAGNNLSWNVNLQNGPLLINQGLVRFGKSVVIGGTFTKVNNKQRYFLTRVNGVEETITSVALSAVVWEFGAQACSPGTELSMDLTAYTTVSSYPGIWGTINQTSFPINSEIFRGASEGNLAKFFLRRPKSSGSLFSPAHIIGWKIDFNQ